MRWVRARAGWYRGRFYVGQGMRSCIVIAEIERGEETGWWWWWVLIIVRQAPLKTERYGRALRLRDAKAAIEKATEGFV